MQLSPEQAQAATAGLELVTLAVQVGVAIAVAAISYLSTKAVARIEIQKAREAAEIELRTVKQEAEDHRKAAVSLIPAPYSMRECDMSLELREDGSGILVRRCIDISSHVAAECRVPYWSLATALSGGFGGFELKGDPEPQPGMRWELIKKTDQAFECDIVLPPGLFQRNREVGFRVKQESSGSFCTHEEQMAEAFRHQRFKYELFGMAVIVPVQLLVVEVIFPEVYRDVKDRAFGTVFYGDSEHENAEELARIQKQHGFSVNGNTARLRVESPERGHQYAIAWTPPPKAWITSV
jgi:hypothetical protein